MLVLEIAIIGGGLLASLGTGLIIDYFIVMKATRPK